MHKSFNNLGIIDKFAKIKLKILNLKFMITMIYKNKNTN